MSKETTGVVLGADQKVSVTTLKLRELGENDVLIKVHSGALNPSDAYYIAGQYPAGKALPNIAGFEGSGIVIATGSGEKATALKDQKVGFFADPKSEGGSWGEHVACNVESVLPIPGDLTYEEAANCFVNPLTAQGMAHTAVKNGWKAIVHSAAASTLGKMLVEACKQAKIELICIVRKPEQVETLKSIGATIILNNTAENYAEELKTTFEKYQPEAFFDAVGGPDSSVILAAMPPNSITFCYGVLSMQPYSVSGADLIFKNKTLKGFWLTSILKDPEVAPQVMAATIGNLATRQFKTTISKTFPYTEFQEAIAWNTANMSAGKVLIQNPNFDK